MERFLRAIAGHTGQLLMLLLFLIGIIGYFIFIAHGVGESNIRD